MTQPAWKDAEAFVTVAVALEQLGRRLDVLLIPTTGAGYARLLGWASSLGRLEWIGIEGAGAFGGGLSRFPPEEGVEVLDIRWDPVCTHGSWRDMLYRSVWNAVRECKTTLRRHVKEC